MVLYTDAGPTGGGVKIFRKIYGEKILLQQTRCTFASCSNLVSQNWYSTLMEQRVQLFALENTEQFSFQHLEIYTDSQNAATMLLNPQKRYSNYKYLSPIYELLSQYTSVEVHWVPRDDPHIVGCDEIARDDIITPTENFFEKFIQITAIHPNFVKNHQNSFYQHWKPRRFDLLILPLQFSLSIKKQLLYKISILDFPVFIVMPKISMLNQWFSYNTLFEIPIEPPFFSTPRHVQAIVFCFKRLQIPRNSSYSIKDIGTR